jgi:hypothetical protein
VTVPDGSPARAATPQAYAGYRAASSLRGTALPAGGTALFAAACLHVDIRFPIIDVM